MPIEKKLSLRSNFVWMLGGNIVFGLCQWAFLVVLAKLGTPEILGKYSLAVAICTPIVLLTNMQLRSILATDAGDRVGLSYYMGIRLYSSLISIAIVLLVVALMNYNADTKMIIICYAIIKALESLSDIMFGYFQKNERLDFIAISMCLRSILSLVSFGITFALTRSLMTALLISLMTTFFNMLFWDFRNVENFKKIKTKGKFSKFSHYLSVLMSFDWSIIRTLVVKSIPLGLGAIILSFCNNVPRYIIESELGEYKLGIFSALAYPMLAGIAISHALGQSVMPRMANYIQSNKYLEFKNLFIKVLLFGTLVGLPGILISVFWGGDLLKLLYNKEYSVNNREFTTLMGTAAISYVSFFCSYTILALKLYKSQLYISLIVLVVTTLSSLTLIQKFGLMGGAMTLCILYASLLVLNLVLIIFSLLKMHRSNVPDINQAKQAVSI